MTSCVSFIHGDCCPLFHGYCSLQLSTSGENGRGSVMLLSTPSQCWQQTAPKVSWLAWKRQKNLFWPSPTLALPILSLKESPRVTNTTTCEHQPHPVSLFSVEQWQRRYHLICFLEFWFLLCPLLLGECCEFHFIAVFYVQFCTVQFVPEAFHCYN